VYDARRPAEQVGVQRVGVGAVLRVRDLGHGERRQLVGGAAEHGLEGSLTLTNRPVRPSTTEMPTAALSNTARNCASLTRCAASARTVSVTSRTTCT
jgi:hypothetical protein